MLANKITDFGYNFQIKLIVSLMTQPKFVEQIHDILDEKHFDNEEYLLAMLSAQQAVEEDGEQASYRHLYGVILTELKQFSEAESHLRKAVSLDPGNAEFQYRM